MRSVCLAILFCFLFSTTGAYAAPITLPQTVTPGFHSTNWDVQRVATTTGSPFTGVCASGTGFGIYDATGPTGASDAYDDAYLVFVNGVQFDPGSTVDLTGTTITAGPVLMSGLNVTVQYYFDTQAALARIMVFLNNPTASPINATVDIPVNFGSDASTKVQMTSSGDTIFTTADRWIVTSDSNTTPNDTVNTTVLFGPGGLAPSAVTQTVFDCANTNGVGATYDVSVPAGETRSLLLFAGLGDITGNGDTNAGAITSAALFNSGSTLPTGALTGLSNSQISSVVNWQGLGAPTTLVPTMTEWGTIIFMALAGLGSIYFLKRKIRTEI